ncbi:MAG: 2-amino-4-hydroxy-6-hydroxymethyldihydropteridine diphosphokinase [Gemmatimonadales bacterium]
MAWQLWPGCCRRLARRWMGSEVAARAWVAVGSNMGDRAAYLATASAQLGAHHGIRLLRVTESEETAPLGGLAQAAYLNQMLLIETTLEPRRLLGVCQAIERAAGRERTSRWCSRTLDLDLVRYGDLLCDLPELSLPHPGLRDRGFWAREIAQLEAYG